MGEKEQHQLLSQARDPFGRPRFYPAGQHPAGASYRRCLVKLNALRTKTRDNPDLLDAVAYAERKIAELEAGEARAKRVYLAQIKPVPDSEEEG